MTKWIITFVLMVGFIFLMNNKKLEMKSIFNDYQFAKGPWAKEMHVDRGREIMRPGLLPFILEIYASGKDLEFSEAMVDACDSKEGTDRLWEFVEDPKTAPLVRTICIAHLLNRNELRVWSLITEQDIETVAASMPAHVVHWKILLFKYTGQPPIFLKNDTFPERHKFKALFRECIQTYTLKEQQRIQLREKQILDQTFP